MTVAAVLTWVVLGYLAIGVLLSRVIFKPFVQEYSESDYDLSTACALGLAWPIALVMYLLILLVGGLLTVLGRLFGGSD